MDNSKNEDLNQALFSYYDERAHEYDEVYSGKNPAILEPEIYKRDVKEISKMCSKFGRGHLIDIGCGTGFWLPYYEKNCTRITLIDQSENMLSECKKRTEKLGVGGKCNFIQRDFLGSNLGNSIFDSAIIGFFLSHLTSEQEQLFFKKMKTILKPVAELMVIDSAWTTLRKQCRKKDGIQERILNDGSAFTLYKRYFDRSDIEKIFSDYSFTLTSFYMGDVFLGAIGRYYPHTNTLE